MNKLYFVKMYHHRLNAHARYLVTAQHEEMAATTALVQAGEGWKADYSEFVCLTPDNVCKEV
jgi:hypothetical protein